ncbi:peptidoglycan/xylan/chitin deacetylase (PgdA/CDA1 family) [Microbacterium resistens]|uniref:Peptidoglycan/xylan/chitin deacetylase (PgdA/CDA1 family) n=1 Tax=Microbacterium resistens TaxID=156977 RepID=A0ABU1S980_9MICO|nr:polysaccharide deacetylase family protein [Microbacterium resistens]MDR6866165.1 peptidoglycan/xylan/chitin deacetylase (PgdA/CDA1 family) [Microbacterium resistens]
MRRRAFLALAVMSSLGLAACAPAANSAVALSRRATRRLPRPPGIAQIFPVHSRSEQAVIDHAGRLPVDWGMHLSGIKSALTVPQMPGGRPRVALTFDACGGQDGSGYDEALIRTLTDQHVPATLFLNHRWAEARRPLVADLATHPAFEIANHGWRHAPLSVTGRAAYGIPGLSSVQEAVDEVWRNHELLGELAGRPPRYFRAGTAHYDDVGVSIVRALGETPLGFSVNGDGGATYSARTVAAEVHAAEAGAVVIAHMNQPGSGTAEGIRRAIGEMRDRGVEFVGVD